MQPSSDGQPDLLTWLRAQIDEDERAAQADMRRIESLRFGIGVGLAAHLALREVEAKRRIVAECARILETKDFGYALAEFALRAFAAIYADRPGYRGEWRP